MVMIGRVKFGILSQLPGLLLIVYPCLDSPARRVKTPPGAAPSNARALRSLATPSGSENFLLCDGNGKVMEHAEMRFFFCPDVLAI